jgi:flagellar basal body-associated protein FliL
MKKYLIIIIVLAVLAAAFAGVVIFYTYFNNRPASAGQGFISPFQLSPYVSHSQAASEHLPEPDQFNS